MKKYKTEVAALVRTGFFHIFGSSVLNKVITFLSSVVLVRVLTKSEYGIFTYSWNIYSILVLLNGMGIDSGMLQLASEHSGDNEYSKRLSNYCVRFGMAFDIALSLLILFIAFFAPLQIKGAREILAMLCFLPMVQILYQLDVSYLRAEKQNKEFSSVSVINTVMIFAFSVGAAFALREYGLVIGYYIAYLFSFFIARFIYKVKLFNKSNGIKLKTKITVLKISFISMLNSGLSQLMYLLDVFVLGLIDPQETILASFKVATMIPSALTFIPISLITYIYPYFAEHRNDKVWCLKKYKRILIIMGSFNAVVSIILFALAPMIIRLMFGDQYLDAVPVFRMLSINYFFSGTFRILSGNLLVTQRKLKFNLLVALISSLTNIVADYFFIQWWGAIGAAAATMLVVFVSSLLSTSYLVYVFKRER